MTKQEIAQRQAELQQGFNCVIIENIEDVVALGIDDWTDEDLANHIGKLLCHFPDNSSLVDFLNSLTGTFEYERQGNYLLVNRNVRSK